jgi:antimicrobial peptide system SdpA family protein
MKGSILRSAAKLAIVLGWSALVVLELRAFMPDNPLRVSKAVKTNLTALAPQGWVFFTRNPREASDRVYRRTTPCCELLTVPNGDPRNLYGIKRDGRAFGVEMTPLLGQIPGDAWRECRGDLGACVAGLPPAATVVNTSKIGIACGEIVIQRQKPVPWAWSANPNVRPPYTVATVNVSCR